MINYKLTYFPQHEIQKMGSSISSNKGSTIRKVKGGGIYSLQEFFLGPLIV